MQEILESIARDIQAACIYIPYGIAVTAVFLAIMILYNRQKYGNVSFIANFPCFSYSNQKQEPKRPFFCRGSCNFIIISILKMQ